MLVSGAGTNLQALLDTVHGREAQVVAVASSAADAPALERAARARRADARCSRAPTTPTAAPATRRWPTGCASAAPAWSCSPATWSCSASAFLERFPGAVINVHPSLLPAFPGLRAIEQALAYGVKVFGVTVHFVDAGVDTGPVILQRAVELPDAREPEEVLAALRPLEHALLPEAVRAVRARARSRPDPANPRAAMLAIRRAARDRLCAMASEGELDERARRGGDRARRSPARCACAGRCCRSPTRRGIVDFARGLRELGVEIVSTGGTARELAEAGIAVRAIEDFTGFPEIMDGRVKTLHPRLYAGLLARRDEERAPAARPPSRRSSRSTSCA